MAQEQTMHPEALKACRNKRNWTRKQLEDKCGFGKGQVSRWERGEIGRVRFLSREKLTKALGVTWEDLTRPPERNDASGALDGRVQLNVRVNRSDRIALQLVCLRYGLLPADVIRLAPLLFLIIAEKSLAHRQAKLDAIVERLDQTENQIRAAAPHLCTEFPRDIYGDEALSSERASISRRDIFGEHVQRQKAQFVTAAYTLIQECNSGHHYDNATLVKLIKKRFNTHIREDGLAPSGDHSCDPTHLASPNFKGPRLPPPGLYARENPQRC